MKRILSVLLAAILLLSLSNSVLAEEEREILQSGDFSYAILDDGTVEITDWAGKETRLEIPSALDGKKVTRIGDRAFRWCGSLTAVTIPDNVTSIGDSAFYSCSSLTAVTIPDSVSEMGVNPFRLCDHLTSINVSPTHPYFATIDGVLYEKATKKLVCYPYAFTATEFAIPQGISVIGDDAFDSCKSLTSVTIPDSVTSIGDYAFIGCSSLTAVSIPDGVTTIGDCAFSSSDLTAVTIPDSVSGIGANPFRQCEKLTSINVSPTHPYFATIDGVLYEKATKRLVCYPCAFTATEFAIPQGITVIGDDAFSWCVSLTAVTIPDTVTCIGDYAFEFCSSLTAVTIPDCVSEMGVNPFRYCRKLTNINVSPTHPYFVTIDGVLYEKATKKLICYPCAFTATEFAIPQGIAVIGDSAFYSCSSLTAVTVPDSVTSIGDYAFIGCKSLTAVTIPDSVTSIGKSAFSSCKNLTITVPHDGYAEAYCKENSLRYIYPETNDWLYN